MTKREEARLADRALASLDRLAEKVGDAWDDYEYDKLSHARALLREWIAEAEEAVA